MYLILMELYVDYTRSLNKVTKQPKYAENSGREWGEEKQVNATADRKVLKIQQKGNP